MPDSTRHRFGDTTPAVPEFTEAKRVTPARPATIESDVVVPFLQGAISGLVVAVGSAAAAIAWHWPWWSPLVLGGGTIGVVWYLLLVDHRSMLKTVETIVNKDLDGDGHQGKPPDHVEFVLKREDKNPEGDSWDITKLPCPSGQFAYLQEFCQDITTGLATFSEKGSRDKSIKGATRYGYTGTQWEQLRGEFIKRGWAYWCNTKDHTKGTEFTAVGKRIIKLIAEST